MPGPDTHSRRSAAPRDFDRVALSYTEDGRFAGLGFGSGIICECRPERGMMTPHTPTVVRMSSVSLSRFELKNVNNAQETQLVFTLSPALPLCIWSSFFLDFSRLLQEGLRVRPTAENLFSTLMQHRKETISQVTLQMLEQVTQSATDATDEALLLRESVYLAIGLSSYDLQETLNFGAWFTGPLAASLRPPEPVPKLHRVIRRRIAALMAAFVDSLRETTVRDAAYQTAVALLSDSDFVVRVTASDAILHLIDDTAFYPANFVPHLEGAVGGLFRLLYDAAEVDTKLRILNVISVLMESMGPKVRPVVANVVQAVPGLWEQVPLLNPQPSTLNPKP